MATEGLQGSEAVLPDSLGRNRQDGPSKDGRGHRNQNRDLLFMIYIQHETAIRRVTSLSSHDDKEAEKESQAVEQEREEAAEPDVESEDEAESEEMEDETEEESEEHESEEVEDREDRMLGDKK